MDYRNQQRGDGSSVSLQHGQPHVREIAEADVRRICNPDLTAPFRNLEDAMDRLLPYHVLATEDLNEADVREAQEAGAMLSLSRWDAWNAYATKKALDCERKKLQLNERIAAAEKHAIERSQVIRAAFFSHAVAETERDLEAEKKRRLAIKDARKEYERKFAEEMYKAQVIRAALQQQEALKLLQMRKEEEERRTQAATEAQKALQAQDALIRVDSVTNNNTNNAAGVDTTNAGVQLASSTSAVPPNDAHNNTGALQQQQQQHSSLGAVDNGSVPITTAPTTTAPTKKEMDGRMKLKIMGSKLKK